MLFKDKNYFEIFAIPVAFQVNLTTLADHYRDLQAQVHPDRVAVGSEHDKIMAIQAASLLNEAYETLSSPQKRAAYLLRLEGIDVDQVEQTDLSSELLLEQIQIREELEELPRDESALDELEQLRNRIAERLTKCQQEFAKALGNNRHSLAKRSYYEMQYFAKLVIEIESLEEDLLGY